jgi:hypothetical protein
VRSINRHVAARGAAMILAAMAYLCVSEQDFVEQCTSDPVCASKHIRK